eukprot:TRINITY_DN3023_c0_g1_i1.p1 TRINITY_DN3023_c0_g1~~TRINITY_DN3023_c0_g1_i1.p1  ORF type:complete len:219 (+),score=33.17 TRINITY_DN3023_c0_g1_i1:738-1394(+)
MLGSTFDDSIGEAFDKIARLLHIQNGGKGLEQAAQKGDPFRFSFPVPLQHSNDCNFSFSGLKTAVLRTYNKEIDLLGPNPSESVTQTLAQDIAASFQRVSFEHITIKLKRSLQLCLKSNQQDTKIKGTIKHVVVSGGVAANSQLKNNLQQVVSSYSGLNLFIPPPDLCVDNGVMVAWAGIERLERGLLGDPSVQKIYPRYPLDTSTSLGQKGKITKNK